jgi:hypothetical protein
VLAIPDSALYRPAGAKDVPVDPHGAMATLAPDGRRLTLTVRAAVPHCPGEPVYRRTAAVLEGRTAVVVVFTQTRTGQVSGAPGGSCALDLLMKPVTYRLTLGTPLGARVLLSADATPIAVTGPTPGTG